MSHEITKMVLYTCPRCNYETSYKQNIKAHVNRKNLCPPNFLDISRDELLNFIEESRVTSCPSKKTYKCEICNACFESKQAKYSHKQRCIVKNTSQEAMSTTDVKVLHEQILKKIEDTLLRSEPRQNIGTQNNINTQNNTIIVLNNFGDESYHHITDEFLQKCLENRYEGVKELIAKIHFSDEAKENRNIRMKSLKHNQVEVANDQTWVVRDTSETTDAMIRKGSSLLKQYYTRGDHPRDITELDVEDLDMRLEMFLATILKNSEQYYNLRRSIVNLIIEQSEEYKQKTSATGSK